MDSFCNNICLFLIYTYSMCSGFFSFLMCVLKMFFSTCQSSHLVKSMRMSAFPLWISVKVSGVTSLQIFSASRKTRRTFSWPICQGKRTILQETNAGVKHTQYTQDVKQQRGTTSLACLPLIWYLQSSHERGGVLLLTPSGSLAKHCIMSPPFPFW